MIKVEGKKIKDKLKNESATDRQKVSLYLSKALYDRFTKACKPSAASRVMEELMEGYVESLK